jgi:dTDP-4-dehydrorhamnose reductase
VIRALVTGAHGQVGADVMALLEGRVEAVAPGREALDLADAGAIVRYVREARPQLIVNAGAYTAVDRAESEPDLARAVNGIAPGVLGEEARRLGALLVHYSTDYVFDGAKAGPYIEDDLPAPLSVYGATKLEGERAVAESGCAHVVLRTSWVYAPRGRNFLLTMLRLARERPEIRVVDDQRGAPTTSLEVARATLALLGPVERSARSRAVVPLAAAGLERAGARGGLYHATASGETTWFGFARAIFEERTRISGGTFVAPRLVAIPTREYPTPARRPLNSVLSCARLRDAFDIELADWRAALAEAIAQVPA